MKRAGAAASGTGGWTLVELVAVLALLGMAVAVLAPKAAMPASTSGLEAARAALRDIDARGRALAANGSVARLSIESGALRLHLAGDEVVSERMLPPGFVAKFGEGAKTVSFRPGTIAGHYDVALASSGRRATVRVSFATGRQEILE